MVHCTVLGCKSDSRKKIPHLSFHTFPNDDKELRQQWILATNRVNWTPSKASKICSKHFRPEAFFKRKKLSLLQPDSAPVKVLTYTRQGLDNDKDNGESDTKPDPNKCFLCLTMLRTYRFYCLHCTQYLCENCESRKAHEMHYVLRLPENRHPAEHKRVIDIMVEALSAHLTVLEPQQINITPDIGQPMDPLDMASVKEEPLDIEEHDPTIDTSVAEVPNIEELTTTKKEFQEDLVPKEESMEIAIEAVQSKPLENPGYGHFHPGYRDFNDTRNLSITNESGHIVVQYKPPIEQRQSVERRMGWDVADDQLS